VSLESRNLRYSLRPNCNGQNSCLVIYANFGQAKVKLLQLILFDPVCIFVRLSSYVVSPMLICIAKIQRRLNIVICNRKSSFRVKRLKEMCLTSERKHAGRIIMVSAKSKCGRSAIAKGCMGAAASYCLRTWEAPGFLR